MSSSITTTLTVGVGLAVVPAVADGELGSVMGSMLLNVHVPTTHTTSPDRRQPDHCVSVSLPRDTGVGDEGVPVGGIGNQMTLSSARALWGCALGGPAKGHPALHERTRAPATHLCLGWAALGGGSPPGGCPPPG